MGCDLKLLVRNQWVLVSDQLVLVLVSASKRSRSRLQHCWIVKQLPPLYLTGITNCTVYTPNSHLSSLQQLLQFQRLQVQFPARGPEVVFFTTGSGWISKCTVYLSNSQIQYILLQHSSIGIRSIGRCTDAYLWHFPSAFSAQARQNACLHGLCEG